MASELQPLRNFILPGGSAAAAQIHVARAICRRAERTVVNLSRSEEISKDALIFLNRLSDFLFILGIILSPRKNGFQRIELALMPLL